MRQHPYASYSVIIRDTCRILQNKILWRLSDTLVKEPGIAEYLNY